MTQFKVRDLREPFSGRECLAFVTAKPIEVYDDASDDGCEAVAAGNYVVLSPEPHPEFDGSTHVLWWGTEAEFRERFEVIEPPTVEITIEVPPSASDGDIVRMVGDVALKADQAHRSTGGMGIEVVGVIVEDERP